MSVESPPKILWSKTFMVILTRKRMSVELETISVGDVVKRKGDARRTSLLVGPLLSNENIIHMLVKLIQWMYLKYNKIAILADIQMWAVRESFTFTEGTSRSVSSRVIRDTCGYTYAFARKKNTGHSVWRCSKQVRGKCKASIHTLEDFIVTRLRHHNH